MPKETVITAWYTQKLWVSQGPDNYKLGLILEVNDGRTVVLCSKVILNQKLKQISKAPTKGKVATKRV
jgi:GLPGLI family protein